MKLLPSVLCLLIVLQCSYAPPVTPDKDKDSEIKDDLEDYMEYSRYLKEVVQALESDKEFRDRLEKAEEDDVRSGKIAEQLDFVNHNIRTQLDEIKRRELERLRHLATKQFELTNSFDFQDPSSNDHVDHQNPHTFEIEDLKKLIKKTTADLEVADRRRKQQFKEYEMQKEFDKHQKIESLDETQKKEYMDQVKKEEDAKKQHKPLHHPGSKQQLEEVWEKQDHMDQQFDPRVFFMMHDVDGNGVWDANEVKALFIKELDKIYGPGGPNKDLHERAEEMERMREHVFSENDLNRDGLIDFNEFLAETKRMEFNQDEGWKSVDENEIYTKNEYEEYERRKMEEIKFLQQRGLVDAHGRPLPGTHHQIQQALHQYNAYQQQMGFAPQHHGQAPLYPDRVPPGYPQQAPGQVYQPPQYPPQGQAPGQFQAPPVQYQGQQAQYQGQQAQYQGQQAQPQLQFQQGQQQAQYQGQQVQQAQQGQFQQQAQQPPAQQGQFQQQAQQPPAQQPPAQYQAQQAINQGQPQQGQYYQGQPPAQQTQGQNQTPEVKAPQAKQPSPASNQGQAPPVPPVPVPQAQASSSLPQGQQLAQDQSQGQAPPIQN